MPFTLRSRWRRSRVNYIPTVFENFIEVGGSDRWILAPVPAHHVDVGVVEAVHRPVAVAVDHWRERRIAHSWYWDQNLSS